MTTLTIIIIIIGKQVHLALRRCAAVRTANAATRQLVLVTPEEAGERDVDEGFGQALLEDIDAGGLHEPAVVPDLPHPGQVRHVGDGDVGGVGVSHTLGLVEEIEFPRNTIMSCMCQQKLRFMFNNQLRSSNAIMSPGTNFLFMLNLIFHQYSIV